MADIARLKQYLIGQGHLRDEQFVQAEDYALTRGIPLDESLLFLNLADYQVLGRALAEISGFPYIPLLGASLPKAARDKVPLPLAQRWDIFPVSYRPDTNILTLALEEADNPSARRHLQGIFPPPMSLAFSVASRAEIKEAISVHYKGKPQVARRELEVPNEFALLVADADARDRPKASVVGGGHSYDRMSDALLSLTSFFVKRFLSGNPRGLRRAREKARLCGLLGLRLGFTSEQMDALVLSTWLSVLEFSREILEQVPTPYGLERIIGDAAEGEGDVRVEAAVLRLVSAYLEWREGHPESSGNMEGARRFLSPHGGSPQRDALVETFLTLIRDEAFLEDVERAGGRILIVDPNAGMDSPLALRLRNDGYDVQAAPGAGRAEEIATGPGVDLVVSEVELAEGDGVELCRTLKGNARTAGIVFFFLTATNRKGLQATCLSAGADDFLAAPVEPEVLSLKVERALSRRRPKEGLRGVRGSLRDMGATDFIQSLSSGEKSVEILLETPRGNGKIYLRGGEIIHAEAGGLLGEEAFYRLIGIEEGEFRILPCNRFPQRTIHAGTMSLLMEGARLMDEGSDP